MAKEKVTRTSQEKAKRDLKIAEIVYYSIGGVAMTLGVIFSIFGLILINPAKENFENSFLKIAETNFFNWLHWNTTFSSAGVLLMVCATIYFFIVFAIFSRKGDEISKRSDLKKSRQRQVVFTAPVAPVTEEAIPAEAREVPSSGEKE